MSNHQRLQANRFEFKYVIDERRARGIRDFIRGYVEPDEYVQDLQRCSYPIHSLYLDTPVLALYRQTVQGMKNRFKLRIRFYDDVPTHPAFLEIKRRLSHVIRKERAPVSRSGVNRLLTGRPVDLADLVSTGRGGRGEDSLERFCHLSEELGAAPATYVSYIREAYVSPGSDQLRVTFDRQIQAESFDWQRGLTPPTTGVAADIGGVVLELKFVDRFPNWMRDMVWAFDLQRGPMAKYVHCVNALGIRPGHWHETQPDVAAFRSSTLPVRCSNGLAGQPASPSAGAPRPQLDSDSEVINAATMQELQR